MLIVSRGLKTHNISVMTNGSGEMQQLVKYSVFTIQMISNEWKSFDRMRLVLLINIRSLFLQFLFILHSRTTATAKLAFLVLKS